MKAKLKVTVEHIVEVTVDEAKFDEEFMQEFRDSFYSFTSIDDHIEHIAQMEARGILNSPFCEGYGLLADMGISARTIASDVEIEKVGS